MVKAIPSCLPCFYGWPLEKKWLSGCGWSPAEHSVSTSYSVTLTHAVSSLHLCYFPFFLSFFFNLSWFFFFFCPLVFCLHTQMVYLISRKVNEYFPWQLYWERGLIGWILKFLSISCISWQNCINTLGQAWIMGWKNTVFQVTDKPWS